MAKDVVDGLRMMAVEFRTNAERSTSSQQQSAFAGRAMIADGAANEIEMMRKKFSHYHVSMGDGTDTCKECGLDLRHLIHRRVE